MALCVCVLLQSILNYTVFDLTLSRRISVCETLSSISLLKLFILLCCFISLSFRGVAYLPQTPSSLQLNHVQVVERHMVSIASEDIHETYRVNAS
jgi:hypothetical protein